MRTSAPTALHKALHHSRIAGPARDARAVTFCGVHRKGLGKIPRRKQHRLGMARRQRMIGSEKGFPGLSDRVLSKCGDAHIYLNRGNCSLFQRWHSAFVSSGIWGRVSVGRVAVTLKANGVTWLKKTALPQRSQGPGRHLPPCPPPPPRVAPGDGAQQLPRFDATTMTRGWPCVRADFSCDGSLAASDAI